MTVREFLARPYHRIRNALNYLRHETSLEEFVPRGHYYSPLPEIEEGARFAAQMSNRDVHADIAGIALKAAEQQKRLEDLRAFEAEFDWPEAPAAGRRFYTGQGFFNIADAFTLFSIMKLVKPRKIIEIGSGFSSALMLDTRESKLDVPVDLTFVEPYPDRLNMLLKPTDHATASLQVSKAQDLPAQFFCGLAENDILFVDSSHVSRVGSDVNFIIFEVLPRLPRGVLVHVHDVFWPFEYPASWVRKGVSWNEAYLIRAFLMFNNMFEIFFWAPYAAAVSSPNKSETIPFRDGQSIWLRRIG